MGERGQARLVCMRSQHTETDDQMGVPCVAQLLGTQGSLLSLPEPQYWPCPPDRHSLRIRKRYKEVSPRITSLLVPEGAGLWLHSP